MRTWLAEAQQAIAAHTDHWSASAVQRAHRDLPLVPGSPFHWSLHFCCLAWPLCLLRLRARRVCTQRGVWLHGTGCRRSWASAADGPLTRHIARPSSYYDPTMIQSRQRGAWAATSYPRITVASRTQNSETSLCTKKLPPCPMLHGARTAQRPTTTTRNRTHHLIYRCPPGSASNACGQRSSPGANRPSRQHIAQRYAPRCLHDAGGVQHGDAHSPGHLRRARRHQHTARSCCGLQSATQSQQTGCGGVHIKGYSQFSPGCALLTHELGFGVRDLQLWVSARLKT